MNALTVVFAALCIFAIGYRFYGLFIANKVLNLNDARVTPAVKYSDGHDYVDTNKYVLFGHHFAAIAAAGPLLGPVLAAQFGYMPGLLWILIGCVLAGGVHDMVDAVLGFEEGTRVLILAPLKIPGAVTFAEVGKQLTKRGGTRSAEELLELVGLDPKRTLESYPHELSGGQCQRVIIAMALTRDPSLVICDEPTTALDVTVQKQVIKLLNDLQKKLGFAMIFVSHDLALVAEVASEITVKYAGQVVETAPTKELLTNPIHEYTQGLLGSVLSIEAHDGSRLHQVPGSVPSPADFPSGDRFAPRSSHPDVGLDVHPILKPVPGADHHFVSEIPDEALAKAGLTSRLEVR